MVDQVYNLTRIDFPKAPNQFRDDTRTPHFVPAPCQQACPIGTDAPSYIAYIWEGKFKEAFEAITATNPFSSICGRVCDAPCEPACRRVDSDGPLMIRNLKRFVMDKVGHDYDPPPVAVTQQQTIGIVGAGPAGLTAAQILCEAGYGVHVYEMSDRLGGMMIWGIPAFRCPPAIIQEDIDRLTHRCAGLKIHLSTALGTDITLDELKQKHDAVLLTIGSWWGKTMQIPGEDDPRVIDGVGFLRRVNGGERPTLPETVVVVGGGDVAMDACRVAKRLPGCKHVKVLYRRGADAITARRIELEGAIEEGIEFVYNTLQVGVRGTDAQLAVDCVTTEDGAELDADGRPLPIAIAGSEHTIAAGMLIAAVGQQAECAELKTRGLMLSDRVQTDFDNMRTEDPKVFAAGDGAFGGSTIVVAMNHGQRAAYYIKAFLEGRDDPLPYRTPYRTRRVDVAPDIHWEKFAPHHPSFFGVGANPVEFPEIEATYDWETARKEASRCYRCDAETGSADYSVQHREDIFSMARTNPADQPKLNAMLGKRLSFRDNPFPEQRKATLDDLVFLPANLSRLVIDPYREACRVSTTLAGKLELTQPLFVTGFDAAPDAIRANVAAALAGLGCGYIGTNPIGADVHWIQLAPANIDPQAAGVIFEYSAKLDQALRSDLSDEQISALRVTAQTDVDAAVAYAVEHHFDVLFVDAADDDSAAWPELTGAPNLTVLRDVVTRLRQLRHEGLIEIIYFGGARSGTDAAKLIGLGANVIAYCTPVALAMGGRIESGTMDFAADYTDADRIHAVENIMQATSAEASMMARCTGKTNLHNVEPEDLRAITLATSAATGIPLAGSRIPQ